MRRRTWVSGVLIALAACGAWGPQAGAATLSSTVEIDGFGHDLDQGTMNGVVESSRDACLANRTVRMSTVTEGERTPMSVDRSSDNGFWGGSGTVAFPPTPDFHAKLLPKRLGPGRRCAGDTDVSTFNRQASRSARRETFPTVIFIGGAAIGDNPFVQGNVIARKRCRVNRRVRIIAMTDDGNVPVDLDRASDNGYFGGGGQAENVNGVRAAAPAVKLAPGKRCAAGSAEITPP